MDRSNVLTLVSVTYTEDEIGQRVPTETQRDVFCSVSSVGSNEFFAAGEHGLNAELKVTMFSPEYDGEEIAIVNGVRYGVYRTFRAKNEMLELYLERKVGV